MKKNYSVSKAFVFHHVIKLYIWPFLIQIGTFGKWLRLSVKSLLSKTEKTQISEQTQIIWVRWSLCLVPVSVYLLPNLSAICWDKKYGKWKDLPQYPSFLSYGEGKMLIGNKLRRFCLLCITSSSVSSWSSSSRLLQGWNNMRSP